MKLDCLRCVLNDASKFKQEPHSFFSTEKISSVLKRTIFFLNLLHSLYSLLTLEQLQTMCVSTFTPSTIRKFCIFCASHIFLHAISRVFRCHLVVFRPPHIYNMIRIMCQYNVHVWHIRCYIDDMKLVKLRQTPKSSIDSRKKNAEQIFQTQRKND